MLKWVVERLDGKAEAVETPIGHVPTPESLDVAGLDLTPRAAGAGPRGRRRASGGPRCPQIKEWFEKFGDKLPAVLWTELDALKARLGAA